MRHSVRWVNIYVDFFFKLLKPAYNASTNYVQLQVILSHLLIITVGLFLRKRTLFFFFKKSLLYLDLLLSIRVVSTWYRNVSHGLRFLLVQFLLLLVTTQMTLSVSKRGTERQAKC